MKNKPHILFICGRNQWRSPTAARLYANDQRVLVRSGGVSSKSRRQITDQDITWADLILVMEQKYKSRISDIFKHLELPKIESLDIPDKYAFMDNDLQTIIYKSTEHQLQSQFGIE